MLCSGHPRSSHIQNFLTWCYLPKRWLKRYTFSYNVTCITITYRKSGTIQEAGFEPKFFYWSNTCRQLKSSRKMCLKTIQNSLTLQRRSQISFWNTNTLMLPENPIIILQPRPPLLIYFQFLIKKSPLTVYTFRDWYARVKRAFVGYSEYYERNEWTVFSSIW